MSQILPLCLFYKRILAVGRVKLSAERMVFIVAAEGRAFPLHLTRT